MQGYVATEWGQLRYSSAGSGSQTIVLLHEVPLSHAAYGRLVPLLTRRFRVVAVDFPGRGESDGPVMPATIEEYAKVFAQGVKALGLKRIVLYGVQTGGSCAAQLAAVTLASRVEGLALSGVPLYPRTLSAAEDPRNAYGTARAASRYQVAEAIGRVACPVLLLSTPLDPHCGADYRFAAVVTGARHVEVPAPGLPVYWTRPQAVAAEITALARRAVDDREIPMFSSADFL